LSLMGFRSGEPPLLYGRIGKSVARSMDRSESSKPSGYNRRRYAATSIVDPLGLAVALLVEPVLDAVLPDDALDGADPPP